MNRSIRFFPRVLILALVVLLLSSSLFSCSSGSAPIEPSEQDIKVVATCGGYNVYYEELRYVTLQYRAQMAARYGADIWDDPSTAAEHLPELTRRVTEILTVNPAILALSEAYDIDPNDDAIQEAVQELIDETVDGAGGRKAYIEMLSQVNMTDHFLRYNLATDMCETELVYLLIDLGLVIRSEKDFLPYVLDDNNFCATLQIHIGYDEGETREENLAVAEMVLGMIESGEKTFREMIGSKYNDDVGSAGIPYYFTYGEYEQAYEDAAFALAIGERSGIIECDSGFYIIERQALSEAHIMANLTELLQQYQYAEIEALIAEERKGMTLEWTEYGASLDLLAIE